MKQKVDKTASGLCVALMKIKVVSYSNLMKWKVDKTPSR
jgi:hypothetical protein